MATGLDSFLKLVPGCTALGLVVWLAGYLLVRQVLKLRGQQQQAAGLSHPASLWVEAFLGFLTCGSIGIMVWALCRVIWTFKP